MSQEVVVLILRVLIVTFCVWQKGHLTLLRSEGYAKDLHQGAGGRAREECV